MMAGIQMCDCLAAHDALRGSTNYAYPRQKVSVEGVGHAGGSKARDTSAIVAVARRLAVVLHRMWVMVRVPWSKDSATILNAA